MFGGNFVTIPEHQLITASFILIELKNLLAIFLVERILMVKVFNALFVGSSTESA